MLLPITIYPDPETESVEAKVENLRSATAYVAVIEAITYNKETFSAAAQFVLGAPSAPQNVELAILAPQKAVIIYWDPVPEAAL